jgi:flagellum-specific peptidoglycan hydrolase FlgJ
MTPQQLQWLIQTAVEAGTAQHVFPEMAACEAALESAYGTSKLAREDCNLFGVKQHKHPIFGTATIPTKEFIGGQWQVVGADWVKYPGLAECFADRMETLRRLQDVYPHYAAALAATDPFSYINEVSKSWSTDPDRAYKVAAIYQVYQASKRKPLDNSADVQTAVTNDN